MHCRCPNLIKFPNIGEYDNAAPKHGAIYSIDLDSLDGNIDAVNVVPFNSYGVIEEGPNEELRGWK